MIEDGKEVVSKMIVVNDPSCVQGNSHLSVEHGAVRHAQDAHLHGNANRRWRSG